MKENRKEKIISFIIQVIGITTGLSIAELLFH